MIHLINFIEALKRAEATLYVLNLNYGNQLTKGLEDRVDQLINLLEKERKELEIND